VSALDPIRFGFRLLTCAFLMCMTTDLMNPFVGGMFTFADDDYFVDGITQPLAESSKPFATTNSRGGTPETVPVVLRVKLITQHPTPRPLHRHHVVWKRVDPSRSPTPVDADASLA
jgi:hypothetical protein